jgi:PKD repeat protein
MFYVIHRHKSKTYQRKDISMNYKIRLWHYAFCLSIFFIASMSIAGEIGKENILTSEDSIELSAFPDSATAPYLVSFIISEKLSNSVLNYQMDYDGDGIVDYSGAKFDNIRYTYKKEGIYYPKVTVIDSTGNSFSSNTTVTILSKEQLENVLKDIWEHMKSALIAGNMETALNYFMPGVKKEYQIMYTKAGPDKIKAYFSRIKSIHLANSYGKVANCGIMIEEADGTFSYPLTFVKDNNGVWKIFQSTYLR